MRCGDARLTRTRTRTRTDTRTQHNTRPRAHDSAPRLRTVASVHATTNAAAHDVVSCACGCFHAVVSVFRMNNDRSTVHFRATALLQIKSGGRRAAPKPPRLWRAHLDSTTTQTQEQLPGRVDGQRCYQSRTRVSVARPRHQDSARPLPRPASATVTSPRRSRRSGCHLPCSSCRRVWVQAPSDCTAEPEPPASRLTRRPTGRVCCSCVPTTAPLRVWPAARFSSSGPRSDGRIRLVDQHCRQRAKAPASTTEPCCAKQPASYPAGHASADPLWALGSETKAHDDVVGVPADHRRRHPTGSVATYCAPARRLFYFVLAQDPTPAAPSVQSCASASASARLRVSPGRDRVLSTLNPRAHRPPSMVNPSSLAASAVAVVGIATLLAATGVYASVGAITGAFGRVAARTPLRVACRVRVQSVGYCMATNCSRQPASRPRPLETHPLTHLRPAMLRPPVRSSIRVASRRVTLLAARCCAACIRASALLVLLCVDARAPCCCRGAS